MQEARLAAAMSDLNTAQAQLDEKQRELDKVQAEYDKAMSHKQMLVDDAERCRKKMEAASALISGLGGEKERWTEQSKEFKAQIGRSVWLSTKCSNDVHLFYHCVFLLYFLICSFRCSNLMLLGNAYISEVLFLIQCFRTKRVSVLILYMFPNE